MALNKVAKAWVKALRSGKYKQGKGSLFENGRYCCLGVLTHLAVKEGVIKKIYGFSLDSSVMEWAGLNSPFGRYDKNSKVVSDLAAENDGYNVKAKTFKQIADIIESEPEGLFVKASK